MLTSLTLVAATVTLIAPTQAPPAVTAPEPVRQIRGRLLGTDSTPVAGALVLACDVETGMPLCGPKWLPFGAVASVEMAMSSMRTVHTDGDGLFLFENAPDRPVKLLAQQWFEPPKPPKPLDVNGKRIQSVGSPARFEAGANEPVTLSPAGTAVLSIEVESSNNESLVIVSTSPTLADPILGFSGWSGAFMRDAIAWNRMPQGETTFVGLQGGAVHITVFSADNNPGFGQALNVELREGHKTSVEIPWVASWSNGVHSPSPAIAEVRATMEKASLFVPLSWLTYLNDRNIVMPEPRPGSRMIFFPPDMLSTRIDLPDEGGQVSVGDSLAALAYENLRVQVAGSGRTLNPYREPVVKIEPLAKTDSAD